MVARFCFIDGFALCGDRYLFYIHWSGIDIIHVPVSDALIGKPINKEGRNITSRRFIGWILAAIKEYQFKVFNKRKPVSV